jgi:hypothetical protein
MGKRVVGEGWTERPLFWPQCPLPLHTAFPKMTEGVSVALLRSPTRVGVVHVVSHTGAMRQACHNRMAGNGHTVGTRARVFTPNGHHTNLASIWVLTGTECGNANPVHLVEPKKSVHGSPFRSRMTLG